MPMNPDVKKRWTEALRSGRYRQTKSALKHCGGFCCLGVLCDLVAPNDWAGLKHRQAECYPDETISDTAGLSPGYFPVLANMNDEGKSFAEIADYIEKEL